MRLRSDNPSSLPLSREVKFIPYNKFLVAKARELRDHPTSAELVLWEKVLKGDKFHNLRFLRQKPLDEFIVDFYCSKLRVAIEVDGEIHTKQKIRDDERDNLLLQKFGIKVLRYENKDVIYNLNEVISNMNLVLSPLIKG